MCKNRGTRDSWYHSYKINFEHRKKMQLPECMNRFLFGLAVMQLHVIKYSSARVCISILHVDDIVFSDMADLVLLGATR
jgi:hypothetical protein